MERSSWCLLLLVSVAGVAPRAPAQDDPPEPAAAAADLDEQLAKFDEAINDRKATRDAEAQGLIDQMLKRYPSLDEKEKASVVKALSDCLLSPHVKREPDQRALFIAASAALGNMGDEGAKVLSKAFDNPKFKAREWIAMRAQFLKNIGNTKDERQVDFLIERAGRDTEDDIMRAAGEALGNFEKSDQKVRKKIVKELIKKFGEIHSKANANLDPGDALVKRAKEQLTAISHDWNESLSKLTGETLTTAPDWQRFYNKKKNDDWDKK
jgi:hypothetical protein